MSGFHTVISAEVAGQSGNQNGRTIWQSELMAWSFHRVAQQGPLTVLISSDDGIEVDIPGAEVFVTRNFRHSRGDDYPPHNRPYSMLDWYERGGGPREETVLMIDPDCIFTEHVADDAFPAQPGLAFAQSWWTHPVLDKFCRRVGNGTTAVGIPIFIDAGDLERVLPWWIEHNHAVREHKALDNMWMAEMAGYILAVTEPACRVEQRLIQVDKGAIVHFCCIDHFDKNQYRPWSNLDVMGSAARQNLARVVNEYVAFRAATGLELTP